MKIPDLTGEITLSEVEKAILDFIGEKVGKKISKLEPIITDHGENVVGNRNDGLKRFTLDGYKFSIAIGELIPGIGNDGKSKGRPFAATKEIDLSSLDYADDSELNADISIKD